MKIPRDLLLFKKRTCNYYENLKHMLDQNLFN